MKSLFKHVTKDIDTLLDASIFLRTVADAVKRNTKHITLFDTETNGLHLKHSMPFLFQCGYIDYSRQVIYSAVVDAEATPQLFHDFITTWHTDFAERSDKYLSANTKFDLHMLCNCGHEYLTENLSDVQFYIRYAHDAVQEKYGGAPLALKKYTAKYITPSARRHEQAIHEAQSAIASEFNKKLLQMLKAVPLRNNPDYKSCTAKYLNEVFTDKVIGPDALSQEHREIYYTWLNTIVPEEIWYRINGTVDRDDIPYNWVDRALVKKYAHLDIYYTGLVFLQCEPTLQQRGNTGAVKLEEETMLAWYFQEKAGFLADKEYLLEAKEKVKQYIIRRRKEFHELLGAPLKVSQSKKLLEIFQQKNIDLMSTNNELLEQYISVNFEDKQIVETIQTLQELRTLEKWYSTYIIRFLNNLHFTDRLYTQVQQVQAVTARVASDFQQFPKDALLSKEGEVLFNPRRLICAEDGLVCIDYSQIELRLQAFYTILVGNPDLNLCRAYMPYQCVTSEGIPFDYTNKEHIANWQGEWYLQEDTSKRWTPTDLHGAMATTAFGVHPGDPNWSKCRNMGKRVNFAKNYGAQLARIKAMFPEKTEEECRTINDAYYICFPGVKDYHAYCYARADHYSYTSNLFGTKYYNASGHKLINILVQGSAAVLIKQKMRDIYQYCKQKNYPFNMVFQVHDELFFRHSPEIPLERYFEFKTIMETWEETYIPIVAEVSSTVTYWSDKDETHTLEELKNVFSNVGVFQNA